ncbi:MAG: pitrilysin family protein [Bacteroidia bacterium]|nr:pitrilysin family protein [Bacteroidia bacterium]
MAKRQIHPALRQIGNDGDLAERTLPNGLRLIHRPSASTRLVHVAVVLDVGSRDEAPDQFGFAHCLEHMAFKGTAKRKSYHILTRIDSVGGELNAFTTKEKVTYHATVTAEHLDRALELLADITFGPTFPAHELEKEKRVIADEIDSYRDDPEEAIFEDFDAHLYGDHPLGHTILGTRSTLAAASPQSLHAFLHQALAPGRVVVSIAGNASPAQVFALAERYFADYPLPGSAHHRQAPRVTVPGPSTTRMGIQQGHLIWGGEAYALTDPAYLPFSLLTYYLGGPSMNSRLALSVRERHGLTYNIQTYNQPFADTGIWGVYAASEPGYLPRIEQLVQREFDALLAGPLPTTTFERLKRQFVGSLIIGHESLFHQLLAQAKDLLDVGRCVTLEELVAAYERLTPHDLYAAAKARLAPEALTQLRILPSPDA